MVASVFGFLGSIIGLIVTGLLVAAGLTFFVVAWKAGVLDDMAGWVTGIIGWGRDVTVNVFQFLRELLGFASS
jgi:hypothetical protein